MLKLHIKEGTFSNSHVAGTVSEFDVQRLLGSKIQTSDVFFSPLDASFHPNIDRFETGPSAGVVCAPRCRIGGHRDSLSDCVLTLSKRAERTCVQINEVEDVARWH